MQALNLRWTRVPGLLAGALWVVGLGTAWAADAQATGSAQPAPHGANSAHDGQHDFDFLVGSWNIHLKRRLHPLTGSNEWVEFDGKVVCRTVWNGHAEVEEFTVDSPEKNIHIQGLATRLYNPKTRQWSIYWANSQNGYIDPAPQVGQFSDGRGEFYGQDTLDGRQIYVRFVWTNITSAAPHFEQSYSVDGGKTWEVNWITEQTRVP
jgi:hypothetical protein